MPDARLVVMFLSQILAELLVWAGAFVCALALILMFIFRFKELVS